MGAISGAAEFYQTHMSNRRAGSDAGNMELRYWPDAVEHGNREWAAHMPFANMADKALPTGWSMPKTAGTRARSRGPAIGSFSVPRGTSPMIGAIQGQDPLM